MRGNPFKPGAEVRITSAERTLTLLSAVGPVAAAPSPPPAVAVFLLPAAVLLVTVLAVRVAVAFDVEQVVDEITRAVGALRSQEQSLRDKM